jgi:hypothetical protein
LDDIAPILGDADAARVYRVTEAMLRVEKLELDALQRAWDG